MERSEFIRLVGTGAGMALLGGCLNGCKKEEEAPAPQPLTLDFILDLSLPANNALNTNGGFLRAQQVIVARMLTGGFIAVASACTHAGTAVNYEASANRFHCPNHGSNFSETGAVVNGPASSALQQMNTSLNGQLLRVWS